MGKLISGINGPFLGKIGTVHGSSWKGKPYVKGPYMPRTEKISDKEKGNRAKFAKAQYWLKPITDFVRVGFKGYTPTWEGFVAAKSHLMKNAMEGTGSEATIDPAKVKVSYGDLALQPDIAVKLIEGNKLLVTWNPEYNYNGVDGVDPDDQVMILAYDIEQAEYNDTTTGQFRHIGSHTLQVDPGHNYHIYVAFNAHDRSRQSDSVYLGTITT